MVSYFLITIANPFIHNFRGFGRCPNCMKSRCIVKFHIKSYDIDFPLNLIKDILIIDCACLLDMEAEKTKDIMMRTCFIDL